MKKISIITPIYNGSRFTESIVNNAEGLYKEIKNYGYKVELICVQDKPDEVLKFKIPSCIEFKLIKNDINLGIQHSRVKGLKEATGMYIIFLDQDDKLIPVNYISQLKKIKNADVVVGNFYTDINGKKRLIYKNRKALNFAVQENTLLKYANTIISPGQCLIRKNKIPKQWCNSIMKVNGADDWMLWLLMYNSGAHFSVNAKPVYYHRTTAIGNLSSDDSNMYNSEKEMLSILHKVGYPQSKLNSLKNTINFNRRSIHNFSVKLLVNSAPQIYCKFKLLYLKHI